MIIDNKLDWKSVTLFAEKFVSFMQSLCNCYDTKRDSGVNTCWMLFSLEITVKNIRKINDTPSIRRSQVTSKSTINTKIN